MINIFNNHDLPKIGINEIIWFVREAVPVPRFFADIYNFPPFDSILWLKKYGYGYPCCE